MATISLQPLAETLGFFKSNYRPAEYSGGDICECVSFNLPDGTVLSIMDNDGSGWPLRGYDAFAVQQRADGTEVGRWFLDWGDCVFGYDGKLRAGFAIEVRGDSISNPLWGDGSECGESVDPEAYYGIPHPLAAFVSAVNRDALNAGSEDERNTLNAGLQATIRALGFKRANLLQRIPGLGATRTPCVGKSLPDDAWFYLVNEEGTSEDPVFGNDIVVFLRQAGGNLVHWTLRYGRDVVAGDDGNGHPGYTIRLLGHDIDNPWLGIGNECDAEVDPEEYYKIPRALAELVSAINREALDAGKEVQPENLAGSDDAEKVAGSLLARVHVAQCTPYRTVYGVAEWAVWEDDKIINGPFISREAAEREAAFIAASLHEQDARAARLMKRGR